MIAPSRCACAAALALAFALACDRPPGEGGGEAASPDAGAPESAAARLFAEALGLEERDPVAARELYVRITLDHANEPDCGDTPNGGRCAEEARARIDVLACREARAGREPSAPTAEALADRLREAVAAPDASALVALAACDFWFGACASDAGASGVPDAVVPALRDRLRASGALEIVEQADEAVRLAPRPGADGRTLELTLTRGEGPGAGWTWGAACETEPPPDVEP